VQVCQQTGNDLQHGHVVVIGNSGEYGCLQQPPAVELRVPDVAAQKRLFCNETQSAWPRISQSAERQHKLMGGSKSSLPYSPAVSYQHQNVVHPVWANSSHPSPQNNARLWGKTTCARTSEHLFRCNPQGPTEGQHHDPVTAQNHSTRAATITECVHIDLKSAALIVWLLTLQSTNTCEYTYTASTLTVGLRHRHPTMIKRGHPPTTTEPTCMPDAAARRHRNSQSS